MDDPDGFEKIIVAPNEQAAEATIIVNNSYYDVKSTALLSFEHGSDETSTYFDTQDTEIHISKINTSVEDFSSVVGSVIFVNTQKRAGAGLKKVLSQLYPAKCHQCVVSGSSSDCAGALLSDFCSSEISSIECTNPSIEQAIRTGAMLVSMLRNPVHVLEEKFLEISDAKGERRRADCANFSAESFGWNSQTRILAGVEYGNEDALLKAIDRVDNVFDFVGIREFFNVSLMMLEWEFSKRYGVNVNIFQHSEEKSLTSLAHKKVEEDQSLFEEESAKNKHDVSLYKHALLRFDRQVALWLKSNHFRQRMPHSGMAAFGGKVAVVTLVASPNKGDYRSTRLLASRLRVHLRNYPFVDKIALVVPEILSSHEKKDVAFLEDIKNLGMLIRKAEPIDYSFLEECDQEDLSKQRSAMHKINMFKMVEYSKVLYMDGDVMPITDNFVSVFIRNGLAAGKAHQAPFETAILLIEPSMETFSALVNNQRRHSMPSNHYYEAQGNKIDLFDSLACTEQGSLISHFEKEFLFKIENHLHITRYPTMLTPDSAFARFPGPWMNLDESTIDPSGLQDLEWQELLHETEKQAKETLEILNSFPLVSQATSGARIHQNSRSRCYNSGPSVTCLPLVYNLAPQKSGTTDMYSRLTKHPNIIESKTKEPHFWSQAIVRREHRNFKVEDKLNAYLDNYHQLVAEKTTSNEASDLFAMDFSTDTLYLQRSKADKQHDVSQLSTARVLKSFQPSAKFLVILRNPIDRVVSDYNYFVLERGEECSPDFVKANASAAQLGSFVQKAIFEYTQCLTDKKMKLSSTQVGISQELNCAWDLPGLTEVGCRGENFQESLELDNNTVFFSNAGLNHDHYGRPVVSAYDVFLQQWVHEFPKDQFHFAKLEDFDENPEVFMLQLLDFLELGMPSDQKWKEMIDVHQRMLPKYHLKKFKKEERVGADAKTRTIMDSFFAPHNAALASITKDNGFLWKQRPTPLVFLKTHKTGSSTIASMLLRFAIKKRLNVAIPPPGEKQLGWPNEFSQLSTGLPPPSHQYDMLCNHAVLQSEHMRSYVKPGAKFVTILREPVSQAVSSMQYFLHCLPTNLRDPSTSIKDIARWVMQTDSYHFHESQAFDLGWKRHLENTNSSGKTLTEIQVINSFVTSLDHLFDLVMIMEHFDESLVLFRRELGWSLADVISLPKKMDPEEKEERTHRKYVSVSELFRSDPNVVRGIREREIVSSALHKHFKVKLLSRFRELGQAGEREVRVLRKARKMVAERCATEKTENCKMITELDVQELVDQIRREAPHGIVTLAQSPTTPTSPKETERATETSPKIKE